MRNLLVLVIVTTFLISCFDGNNSNNDNQNGYDFSITPEKTFYIQLYIDDTHPLRTDIPADVYEIDLFDNSKETINQLKRQGKIVICYFNAGAYENWRPDKDKFPQEAIGNPLQGWEGEYWLDIRNDTVREIMKQRLNLAVEKGCNGVEADNVNGYENDTGFNLTYEDQLNYNRFLADEAHKRGLSIGLKNDGNQVEDLVDYFDFSVNEECHQYNECELYYPFVDNGKAVFNIEYDKKYVNSQTEFKILCQTAKNENFRTIVAPINLDGSFVKSCDYGEY